MGLGLGSPLTAVQHPVKAAGIIVGRLDRVLSSVERLATSLESIERHMVGMRSEINRLHDAVDGLREDVHGLGGVVGDIREATVGMDAKVTRMQDDLDHIEALARSVPGFRRRTRAAAAVSAEHLPG